MRKGRLAHSHVIGDALAELLPELSKGVDVDSCACGYHRRAGARTDLGASTVNAQAFHSQRVQFSVGGGAGDGSSAVVRTS